MSPCDTVPAATPEDYSVSISANVAEAAAPAAV